MAGSSEAMSASASDAPMLPDWFEDSAAISAYVASAGSSEVDVSRLAAGKAGKRELLLGIDMEERQRAIATAVKARVISDLKVRGKCEGCMLQTAYCICGRLRTLRETTVETAGTGARVRFVVWMHFKERKRASNTGKLLEALLPGSEVLLDGVPEDMLRFQELRAAAAGRVFVLFPSEDALPVDAALAQMGPAPAPSGTAAPATPPALAVLVDGTWSQARRMRKSAKELQGVRDVALAPTKVSEFHWRRQSVEGRISTLEAAALLLEDMGEPAAVSQALLDALAALCGALERQCHYDTLVDCDLPMPGLHKQAAMRSRLPKKGPGLRGYEAAVR